MGATSGLFLRVHLDKNCPSDQKDCQGPCTTGPLTDRWESEEIRVSAGQVWWRSYGGTCSILLGLCAHRTPHWIALSQGSAGHVTQRQRRGGVGARAGEERAGHSYLRVLLGNRNDANIVLNCLKQLSPIRKTKSAGKCLGSTMDK